MRHTTIYPNYAINLWQQTRGENAATRHLSIFSAEDSALTQFDWQVRLYQFDLSASNMFSVWLMSSSPNGDGSGPISATSYFFNISDTSDAPDSLSTTPYSTPLPLATSTTIPTPSWFSTSAQAGIGVGLALTGLEIITIFLLLFCGSTQRRSYRAPIGLGFEEPFVEEIRLTAHYPLSQSRNMQTSHVELGHKSVSGRDEVPVELPASREYAR
ncbi:hypothetical protein F4824DRAFT_503553 [Ustulina deusta]|nr:hypothetical protein F4824DRAFT_503553 [Ustulina deusta]